MKKRSWLLVAATATALVLLLTGTALAKPSGTTYYVNAAATGATNGTSWQDAFTDLQSAIDEAVAGDSIWVAAGTYTPSMTIDGPSEPRTAAFVLKSGVAIYGSFAGDENLLNKRPLDPSTTVLSGDIGTAGDDTDNSYHVIYADGVTDAVLDGFTVTGGRGDVSGRDSQGAGMYNKDSSLTVSNCSFVDNQVAVRTTYLIGGAGAGMYNLNSAPTVTNCIFSANQAGNGSLNSWGRGGGMYNFGLYNGESSPLITGCTFTGNIAARSGDPQNGGGGMYSCACAPTVDRCTFAGNSASHGGGMFNAAETTVTNCIFRGNFTMGDGQGAGMFNAGGIAILNCTFYRNGWQLVDAASNHPAGVFPYTVEGGAICELNSGSTITNCIFLENAARGRGGALAVSSRARNSAELTNCLFFGNLSWPMPWAEEDRTTSDVRGNHDDLNTLYGIDPLLVNPAEDDFRLRYDSPCIDAGFSNKFGNYSWPVLPADDFYGVKRIIDGDGDTKKVVDIGAAEYVPNLPDLGAFLQGLADAGAIDPSLATRLLAYVGAAQTAMDQGHAQAAIGVLKEMITDVQASLGDTETAQAIERKTEAVIERL